MRCHDRRRAKRMVPACGAKGEGKTQAEGLRTQLVCHGTNGEENARISVDVVSVLRVDKEQCVAFKSHFSCFTDRYLVKTNRCKLLQMY